jgi:hypothetical protein
MAAANGEQGFGRMPDATRGRYSRSQLCYLCASVFTKRVSCVEEGWLLKHRGTEEHRGKGLRMRGKMGDESRRPTNPIPASLGSLVAGVFRSPIFFRPRSCSGRSNGGGVFLRISAVREDGAGVLSGGGCSRVVVLPK